MPTFAFADTYYIVKSGDSLWKIANSYSVSIEQIKKLNSLNSDLLHPGQSLLVNKSNEARPATAEVAEISRGTSRPDTIISYAKEYIGVPYRGGGQTPRGFDCSGYVQYVFKNFGINLPRTAAEQYSAGSKVDKQEAEPGDIVAFKTGKYISHSGIYLGGSKFISSTSSHGVAITSINDPYWSDHFLGFSRILR